MIIYFRENTSLDEIEDEIEDFIPHKTSMVMDSAKKEDAIPNFRDKQNSNQGSHRDVPKISIVLATEQSQIHNQSRISRNEEEMNIKQEESVHSQSQKAFERNIQNPKNSFAESQMRNSHLNFESERSPYVSQRSNDIPEKEEVENDNQLIEEQANQTTYFCGEVENDLDSVFDPLTTIEMRKQEDIVIPSAKRTDRITTLCSEERREPKRLRTCDSEVVFKSAESNYFLIISIL